MRKLIKEYISGLEKKAKEINGIEVKFVDDHSFWEDVLANPSSIGLSTDNGPCIPGIGNTDECSDLEKHFFWDSYHPEAKTHKAFGAWAFKELKKNYDF